MKKLMQKYGQRPAFRHTAAARTTPNPPVSRTYAVVGIMLMFASLGSFMLTRSHAATLTIASEAEQGAIAGNNTAHAGVTGASGNGAVEFGTNGTGGSTTDPVPNGVSGNWKLVFGDDFNGTALDKTKWIMCNPSFDSSCNPHNNEQQKFNVAQTGNDNVVVSGGQLHLITNKKNGQIWSGMVSTGPDTFGYNQPGYKGFNYTYGLYEGRVKFPKGNGFWPSLWQLPQTGYKEWPKYGEYDVVEIAGNDPTYGHYTVHKVGNSCGSSSCIGGEGRIADSSANFHTYALDWQPNALTWYVDGQQVAKVTDTSYIRNNALFIIANFSVGGNWPPLNGAPDASTPFPTSMDIDYLRVWQRQ